MTIWDMQKAFQLDAELLGDYQSMNKTQLANGYCDADEEALKARVSGDECGVINNEALRSAYHSALMLRYWYKIFEWQKNSYSLNLEATDFVDWLADSLYVAFYYRTWRYEYQAKVKDGSFIEWKLDENGNKIKNDYYYVVDANAPDKIINRCCASMRGRVYQYHNKDKRKADVQTYSLDAMVDENGDSALDYAKCYTGGKTAGEGVTNLIAILLSQNEDLEALIVDGIANYETYRETKEVKIEKEIDEETGEEVDVEYPSISTSFDSRKLIKHLNLIDEKFIINFCNEYSIPSNKGIELYKKLKKLSNTKLYKMVEKTLIEIKQSKDLLQCLD